MAEPVNRSGTADRRSDSHVADSSIVLRWPHACWSNRFGHRVRAHGPDYPLLALDCDSNYHSEIVLRTQSDDVLSLGRTFRQEAHCVSYSGRGATVFAADHRSSHLQTRRGFEKPSTAPEATS
jgi:hypothetical protein